jgi:hypothetical protein
VDVTFRADATVKDKVYATSVAGGGICTPSFSGGILDLPPNTAFIMNLSAGVAVGGSGKYVIKGPVS